MKTSLHPCAAAAKISHFQLAGKPVATSADRNPSATACRTFAFTPLSKIKLLAFICAVMLIAPAFADSITYDITYDPVSGTTTLLNLPSSSVDLEYWTQTGPMAGQQLWLLPGGEAQITKAGKVKVGGGGGAPPPDSTRPRNKKNTSGTLGVAVVGNSFKGSIVVHNPAGGVVSGVGGGGYPGGSGPGIQGFVFVPQGDHIGINGTGTDEVKLSFDAILTPLTPTVELTYDGFNMGGDNNVELLSGGVESADNSESFTTIETPSGVGTGCAPEPSTLTLFVSGLLALAGTVRRKLKRG